MLKHKSAVKRKKQAEVARQRNRKTKSELRAAIKTVRSEKDKEKRKTEFGDAVRQLDMAARKRVIHKNKAARLKSRLAKKINAK